METSNIDFLRRIERHRAWVAARERKESETQRYQQELRALRLQHRPLDEFSEAAETSA